jgi:hypothetical protein
MKSLVIFSLALTAESALAMGAPRNNEQIEGSETITRMGLFSKEQGYQDQQMLEEDPERMEDKIEEAKARDEVIESGEVKETPADELPPFKRPQIH